MLNPNAIPFNTQLDLVNNIGVNAKRIRWLAKPVRQLISA
jgi:hypothetical protein